MVAGDVAPESRPNQLGWLVERNPSLGVGQFRGALSLGHGRFNMKLDVTTFRQLRRLAPILDDVLNAGEVEHAEQAVGLASLA